MPETINSLFERIGGRGTLLKLLRYFYADVQQHEVIGAIFNAHIKNWPSHIEKIANFWSGLTGGPALYGGGMAMKHLSLGLGETHFEAWLSLWKRTCSTHLAETEAEEMIFIANRIGRPLRAIIANKNKPTLDLFS